MVSVESYYSHNRLFSTYQCLYNMCGYIRLMIWIYGFLISDENAFHDLIFWILSTIFEYQRNLM